MRHICVSDLTNISSDNGLSPARRQAIIWTNAGILLNEPLGTNFSEILIGIQIFSFKKMRLKMSSAKWRPFCFGLNVLIVWFLCYLLPCPHGLLIRSPSTHTKPLFFTASREPPFLLRHIAVCLPSMTCVQLGDTWQDATWARTSRCLTTFAENKPALTGRSQVSLNLCKKWFVWWYAHL